MKQAEPIDTSAIVRTPTGESRLVARPRPILSKPSAEPEAAATTNLQHIWSCASVETVGSACRATRRLSFMRRVETTGSVCRATGPRRLSQRSGDSRGGARAAAVVARTAIVGRRMLLLKLPVLFELLELCGGTQCVSCNPQRGDPLKV